MEKLAVVVVQLEAGGQEHQLGAEPACLPSRHRGADPEPACLVARRGNHAAGPGPAHCHRLAGQGRVLLDLDRDKEGIHVDVQDPARAQARTTLRNASA